MDGYEKYKIKQGNQKRTKCTCSLSYVEVGKSLGLIGTGEIFLNRTPVAHALRSRIDK